MEKLRVRLMVLAAVLCAAVALIALRSGPGNGPSAPVWQTPWDNRAENFGGISGIDVADGGNEFWAVSDQGILYQGRLERDAAGHIAGVTTQESYDFLDTFGNQVSGFSSDSEALRVLTDGSVLVAFEGLARVAKFRPPDMAPSPLHEWDRFRPIWGNTGMEALAIDAGGQVIAILERPEVDKTYRSLIYLGEGMWDDGPPLISDGRFMATDADVGPDGRLYVLERRLSYIRGYTTRISAYVPTEAGYSKPETILETSSGSFSDFEGLSLWTDPTGRLIATLVSDNNFLPFSATMLAEVTIHP